MSCWLPFGADQFNENPQERQAKNSFFNWCFFTLCFSVTSVMLTIVYIQENVGWAIGIGILAISMAFVIFLFLLGRKSYWHQAAIGNPLTRIVQVLVATTDSQVASSLNRRKPRRGMDFSYHGCLSRTRPLLWTNQLK